MTNPDKRRCPHCQTRIDISALSNGERQQCRCGKWFIRVHSRDQGRAVLAKCWAPKEELARQTSQEPR